MENSVDERAKEFSEGLSVCPSCFDKTVRFLKKSRLCHACFFPVKGYDYATLMWIGDEQVVFCGQDECKEKIRQLDRLDRILAEKKNEIPKVDNRSS